MSWLTKVFGKPETRSSYTDFRLQAAWQNADGGGYVGDVRHTAALETVCRLYESVFSSSAVEGPAWLQRALSSTWRAQTVRAMLRYGEAVDVVESAPGGLSLLPVAMFDVKGGPRPDSWVYATTLDGPSGTVTRPYAADDVLHVRWATERGRPWQGIGPMMASRSTGQLVGGLETRQSEESSAPVGSIIPVSRADGDDPLDEATDPLYQLRADVRASKGRTLLPETQMGIGDPSQRPHSDWKSTRFGGCVPEEMVDLRTQAGMSVALACGVPLPLVEHLATGIGQFRGWQRFMTSCTAVWAIVADEVEAKLGARPGLDLSTAGGNDLAGRSQAFGRLVGEGKLSSAEALKVVGL